MVRAKFKCVSVSKRQGWGDVDFMYAAEFTPVIGDTPENKEFFASTPAGSIQISTIRSDHFEVGQSYYIDFTQAVA